MQSKLSIKHMVCQRCIQTVDRLAREEGLQPIHVGLGELVLSQSPGREELQAFNKRLQSAGFEIAENETARLVNKVKTLIIERTHFGHGEMELKLSAYLARETNTEYSRLSKLFSAMESVTIERFATLQKIEKVKELLVYGELNVSQIADQLGYSSAAHLSAQFKQVTGMTPSQFKQIGVKGRRELDLLGQ